MIVRRLRSISSAQALRVYVLAVVLHPFVPRATASLWVALGAEAALGPLAAQNLIDAGRWGQLPVGAAITKGESLFPRLPDDAPPA